LDAATEIPGVVSVAMLGPRKNARAVGRCELMGKYGDWMGLVWENMGS
jgi:hypothetical protein